jgi:hypothetical protein
VQRPSPKAVRHGDQPEQTQALPCERRLLTGLLLHQPRLGSVRVSHHRASNRGRVQSPQCEHSSRRQIHQNDASQSGYNTERLTILRPQP